MAMWTQLFWPHNVAASAMNRMADSSWRAFGARGSRTSRKIDNTGCIGGLPNQETPLRINFHPVGNSPSLQMRFPWAPERVGETVRGRDRILDREVDPDAADRRHRVRGVADAQQAGPPPALQAVDRDRQELDVLPAADLADPVAQERGGRRDTLAQGVEAPGLH